MSIMDALSQGASATPYGAAISAVTGMAAGGPSSAETGDGGTAGSTINIGGNNAFGGSGSQGTGTAASDFMGIPTNLLLGGLVLVGLVLFKR